MSKNEKKNFILISAIIVSILCLCIFATKKVYAYRATMPYVSTGGSTAASYEPPKYHTLEYKYELHRYYCIYRDNLVKLREININAYNEDDKTIIPFTYISLVDFKAGTAIGMNIQEYKTAHWSISSVSYYEILIARRCIYEPKEPDCTKECDCGSEPSCSGCDSDNPFARAAAIAYYQQALAAYKECLAACEKCKHKCDDKKDTITVVTHNEYYKTTADATLTGCPKERSVDENLVPLEWLPCCKIEIDPECHQKAQTPAENGAPIAPYRDNLSEEAKQIGIDLAAADTSDKRALPFVETPTIEIELLDPNEYNPKELKLKKFSGYKVLIDEDIYAKDPRPTWEIEHYYEEGEIPNNFYHLEDFYLDNKNHIKTIHDPEEKKTKLPPADYKPKQVDNYHVSYEYSPDAVCIDVQTSKVYYDTDKNDDPKFCQAEVPKKENIKEVKNTITEDEYLDQEEVEIWHYFIPLDTTTTSCDSNDTGFFVSVSDKYTTPMDSDYCASILRHLAKGTTSILNYTDILLPIKDGTTFGFVDDYTGDSESSSDYNMFAEQGYECLFSVKTRFNIKQKFYGEIAEDGHLSLKGYGFYYRPIDVTKPFPNAIAEDSIWKIDLYNASTNIIKVKDKEVKLSESFAEVTYSTKEIASDALALQKIRDEALGGEKYTSFKDLDYTTGLSPFVEKNNLRRNADLKAIYKLGCGPDNTDWVEGECDT